MIEQRPPPINVLSYPSLDRQRDRSNSPKSERDQGRRSPFKPGQFSPPEENDAWMNPPALLALCEKHFCYSRDVEARFFDTYAKRVGVVMQVLDLGEAEIAALMDPIVVP